MCAGGAELGGVCTNNDMSAVAAFPNLYLALCEYSRSFNVAKQSAISLLVMSLNFSYKTELLRKLVEALLVSGLSEISVHS